VEGEMKNEKQIMKNQINPDQKNQENTVVKSGTENDRMPADQEWVYDMYEPVPVLNYAYH